MSFSLVFALLSCENKPVNLPNITHWVPSTLDATINGNILTGPSVLNDSTHFVWGASVVKGDDGKYHMFFSTWECGDSLPKFSDGWLLLSKIGYAISDYPDRNFKFQKIILKGRIYEGDSLAWDAVSVHNPHIKKFKNKFYLYYTGSMDPGIQPSGSAGENLSRRNRIQQSQKVGVIAFDSMSDILNGNFSRPNQPLLVPRTRVKNEDVLNPSPVGTKAMPDNLIVVNPSVVERPDGKYFLYFKGNWYEPHWKGVHGVAVGDSPEGPFQALDTVIFDIRQEDGKIASGEDPYVWYSKKDHLYYAVLKDFGGAITGKGPGLAFLKSDDGLSWKASENSFFTGKYVILANGDTVKLHHLERPQFLLNEDGHPEVFYAAASYINIGGSTGGETFNVHMKVE